MSTFPLFSLRLTNNNKLHLHDFICMTNNTLSLWAVHRLVGLNGPGLTAKRQTVKMLTLGPKSSVKMSTILLLY